jgi:hypothetical protein
LGRQLDLVAEAEHNASAAMLDLDEFTEYHNKVIDRLTDSSAR